MCCPPSDILMVTAKPGNRRHVWHSRHAMTRRVTSLDFPSVSVFYSYQLICGLTSQ